MGDEEKECMAQPRRKKKVPRTVFILSVSSDIGLFLAREYLKNGDRVIGTYRTKARALQTLEAQKGCVLIRCDISKGRSLQTLYDRYAALKTPWDIFISCVGEPRPVQAFFDADFDAWLDSVTVNSFAQLRVLHLLYPLRKKGKKHHAVFFAGGGVNKPVRNFSAYTVGKILLIKMCEYLDEENKDLNIFIVGPGWTKTKIHQLILNDPHVSADKYRLTQEFLTHEQGTSYQDIFDCINGLVRQGKAVASGRNFSVVHDPWRGRPADSLIRQLKKDPHMYKLRRHGSMD